MISFLFLSIINFNQTLSPQGGKSVIRVPKLVPSPQIFLIPAKGFKVELFADHLNQPRKIAIAPNGDVFVVLTRLEWKVRNQPHSVVVLGGFNKLGLPTSRSTWSTQLNYPFGIQFGFDHVYVANTGSVVRWNYTNGQKVAKGKPEVILDHIPERGYRNHWTRNILFDPSYRHLFLTIGSVENLDQEIARRAVIERFSLNANGKILGTYETFSSGMRNPIGLAIQPTTGTLWANVAERDYEGDHLVPDFLTSVQQGGFYGWPYAYIGNHHDPRMPRKPALEHQTIVPDVLFPAHATPIDVVFINEGAVVTLHGSQNRSKLNGYKVVLVPFGANHKPSGPPQDLVTGWLPKGSNKEIYGRPAGLAVMKDGSILIVDDWGGKIWRLSRL